MSHSSKTKSYSFKSYLILPAAGVSGCIAETVSIPLDTIKVRLQVENLSAVSNNRAVVILNILRNESWRSLYSGLSAGLVRQMTMTSIKFGLYDKVKDFYRRSFRISSERDLPKSLKMLAASSTGFLAVCLGQPTDVVKVRMQVQGSASKRYSGLINAYSSIWKQEGVRGLWKGWQPSAVRNMVINTAEIGCYDIIHTFFIRKKLFSEGKMCNAASALVTGVVATITAQPFDTVKSRYSNSPPGVYKSIFDCIVKMSRENGIRTFYQGVFPAYCRLALWNFVVFMSYEEIKKLLKLN